MGMHVYFPGVVLSVDMSTSCHLSYEPLGKSAPMSSLHYVQPWCPPVHYPAESSAFRAPVGAKPSPELRLSGNQVLIEDDGLIAQVACDISDDLPPPIVDTELELPTFFSLVPKQLRRAKSTTFLVDNLALISKHLQVLSDWLSGLTVSASFFGFGSGCSQASLLSLTCGGVSAGASSWFRSSTCSSG
jgi:hypothetical protein